MPEKNYQSIIALVIFLALWIDGNFYPLILLPFLFITFFSREGLTKIGFSRENLRSSLLLGVLSGFFTLAAYYPIHLLCLNLRTGALMSLSAIFTDLVWYPFYEEVSYRGFFLGMFSEKTVLLSRRNMSLNLIQALMFASVHHHHVSAGQPLLLIPLFILGLLSGLIFLKSRNIAGCLIAHVLANGLAWVLTIYIVG